MGMYFKITQSFFILICNDRHRYLLSEPSAFNLAKERLKARTWGLNSTTPNRQKIKKGDQVVIFCTGKRMWGRHLIGHAHIEKAPVIARRKNNSTYILNNYENSEYEVRLSNVLFFKKFVPLLKILTKLKFIPRTKRTIWWHFLRSGCKKISKDDFKIILKKGFTK